MKIYTQRLHYFDSWIQKRRKAGRYENEFGYLSLKYPLLNPILIIKSKNKNPV